MGRRDAGVARGCRGIAVLSVAVLLASCKGGDGQVKAGGTTAPSASATSTAPPTTDPARAVKAQAAVLQMSDFPPGWKTHDPDQGLKIDTVWDELTRCVGVETATAPVAAATSPTYLQGLATQARATVSYTTEPAASAIANALAGSKFNKCATDAFTADVDRSKPEGSKAGGVQVAPRDYPQFGQKTLAWRINATVNLDELQVPLFQDFLVVFNGGTVIRLLFLNPGSEFPQNLQRSLVEKVVSRA